MISLRLCLGLYSRQRADRAQERQQRTKMVLIARQLAARLGRPCSQRDLALSSLVNLFIQVQLQ